MKIDSRSKEILKLKAQGLSQRKIATKLNCSRMVVRYTLKNPIPKTISPILAKQLREKGKARCPKCSEVKRLSEFSNSKSAKYGRASYCKYCSNTIQRASVGEYRIERYKKNKKRLRNNSLKRKYGISLEEYHVMVEDQKGLCAICGEPEKNKSLAVDHNHKTGKIRGLLCGRCNPAVGFLKDSIPLTKKLLKYLEKYQ